MTQNQKPRSPRRRAFLAGSVAAVGTLGSVGSVEAQKTRASGTAPGTTSRRQYNGPYEGENLSRVAFPLGGMGAGMLCLEGTGALSHVSLRHQPDIFNEPCVFAAVRIKGDPNGARVVEGPVPSWKTFGLKDSGNGSGGATWGLPRFGRARFAARFPFGTVTLEDDVMPLVATITGWSPFEAGDPDSSSLPFAALRRPDPRREGRRGGCMLRPAAGLRGAAFARSHRVRAVFPRVRRHQGDRGPDIVVRGDELPAGRRRL